VDINVEKASLRINGEQTDAGGYERLVETSVMNPPYHWPAGYFDAVICSEVLEHLWDLRVVHKEAKRLLKRDGVYVISTPNFDWIQNHMEHFRRLMPVEGQSWTWEHIRHYNYDNHVTHLNATGFVVDKHTGADAHYCPVFANACRSVRDGLRRDGIEVSEERLHQLVGEGVPHYQHTAVIASKKA
jgi:SAM-dependent methyltransferase